MKEIICKTEEEVKNVVKDKTKAVIVAEKSYKNGKFVITLKSVGYPKEIIYDSEIWQYVSELTIIELTKGSAENRLQEKITNVEERLKKINNFAEDKYVVYVEEDE